MTDRTWGPAIVGQIEDMSEAAREVLRSFREDPPGGTTTVEQLELRLADVGITNARRDLVELLRRLEDSGLGRFIVGRRGHKSRFEWANEAPVAEVVAKRDHTLMEDILIEHSFVLRPGFELTIELPADLTKVEAERFAAFIKTIPFV